MNTATLKVRISEELKNAVAQAARDNSLDMSSFVRLVLTRATKAHHVPNATTQAAIHELESGGGTSVDTIDAFWDKIFQ
ncbi:type II toxin-antitoxin system RelB/DinJ family antitoxin [Photorhabdus antumapuensis]|uniref:type II toxin-antitoxin system RelB/DinJ family antitoxin n=1 Tax=Photorhabdus antumapuensis TaxID=2862867 RepID=UPI001CED16CF|nr:type II toxin-antitoxin system RelB/DinJ family antitoxin [Photorhabdus antumapuensis]MCA6219689.1 type II toxin-antitoxin system RelB/DinJ family antitoxin [Photorhabdus antumapuensis]